MTIGAEGVGEDRLEFYEGMTELHKVRMIPKADPLVRFLYGIVAFAFFGAGSSPRYSRILLVSRSFTGQPPGVPSLPLPRRYRLNDNERLEPA